MLNNKIDWPKSGCTINNIITNESINKVKKYLLYKFLSMFEERIFAIIRTKNGFNSSIGWNLGKKNRSNHLLEPFTSDPIKGTNRSKKNAKKKKYGNALYINSFF